MRFRIRTLFILTTLAAVLAIWLTTRQTKRFPSALFQTVQTSPSAIVTPQGNDIVDALYQKLLSKLESADYSFHSRTLAPLSQLRKLVRFERLSKNEGFDFASFEPKHKASVQEGRLDEAMGSGSL